MTKKTLLILILCGVFLGGMLLGIVARGALTFDADLLYQGPGTSARQLGEMSRRWRSINGLISFEGDYVGIGEDPVSGVSLSVNGMVRLNTTEPRPDCDGASKRGTLWVVQEGTSTKDRVEICVSDGAGVFWYNLIP